MKTAATDPADLGAIEARDLIAKGALSPVELATACIARTEAVNHAINAVVAHDFDRTLDEARALPKTGGVLHGLPFGVKDMIDVTGLPTTFGSTLFRDNVATSDDPMVAAMRRAGGVVLGKTNNPEFSAGGNTRNAVYGATANPHDLTRSAAGSSGGSAAALAAGMAPLATGSDTGGSLRNPAAFCGVVGFRPSPGVVPGQSRGMAMMHLATGGPMARSVADAGLMLSVIARPDPRDPYTAVVNGRTAWEPASFAVLPEVDPKRLRFAVTADFGFTPTESIVRDAFAKVIATLAPFLGGLDGTHPDCAHADRIFAVLRAVGFLSSHHALLQKHPDGFGPNIVDNVREGEGYSALDVADAILKQAAYHRNWEAFFDGETDFILSPAVTISPRDWHELYPREIDGTLTQSYYHWLALAYASTLSGCPSITIPAGRDANGMPFGLQIIGRRNNDAGVLAVAAAIESIIAGTSLAVQRPDITALQAAPPLSEAPGFMTFD